MSYRDGERFPLLSTFKMYAAAALLHEHPLESGYFDKVLRWTEADLAFNSPVTSQRVATGMTILELCDAAVTRSDNTAGNLLLKELGGPAGLTAFAREIGDEESRLDRWEPELNTAIPGDERDTTTPRAWASVVRSLVLSDTLGDPEREQLTEWLLANKTGDERIRAGVPAGWKTGEKTGTGSYGSANDVGVTWTPDGTPIVLAIMTTAPTEDADPNAAPLAAAAKAAVEALT
jgi:beta-lactamase class A